MFPTDAFIQAAADRHDRARPHAHAAQASDCCGVLQILLPDSDRVVECDLVKCAHCCHFWQFIPGSGRRRGRCMRCGGLLCGSPYCMRLDCSHAEQRLLNMEAGRALDFRPVTVTLSGLIIPA